MKERNQTRLFDGGIEGDAERLAVEIMEVAGVPANTAETRQKVEAAQKKPVQPKKTPVMEYSTRNPKKPRDTTDPIEAEEYG